MSKKFANPEEQIKAGVLFCPAEPEVLADNQVLEEENE